MLKKIRPFSWLKKSLPQGLLGRSALIMIAPVLLVQLITTYVFYDRHWKKMTDLLGENIAGSMNACHELLKEAPQSKEWVHSFQSFIHQNFNLRVAIYPATFGLPKQNLEKLSWREEHLFAHLKKNIQEPFYLSITQDNIVVYIHRNHNIIELSTETKRLFTRTTPLLIWWAVGSPIFFLLIAFLFMRNQVRPLKELAESVDTFGKGRPVDPIKPSGALEVRQAAHAFNAMRERILAQIQQRTEMLAGVSHDLRTPLTRMALEVALLPETQNREELQEDIRHMKNMIDEYLAFVQGSDGEVIQAIDLKVLLDTIVKRHPFQNIQINLPNTPCYLQGQSQALQRCFINLFENALKYGSNCHVFLNTHPKAWEVIIDDDGPGIPLSSREHVFKPFFRLDDSRNSETGGVGLGLAITKDIIHKHGGTIFLDESPLLKGLRIVLKIPF